ncbi:hypothetical protein ACH5A3_03950 [Streptomyces echinatus]|uniref:hypothetical protein n=1 Tax=Streptomyces echinatus TaxID=67293 RepID=UPI00379AA862
MSWQRFRAPGPDRGVRRSRSARLLAAAGLAACAVTVLPAPFAQATTVDVRCSVRDQQTDTWPAFERWPELLPAWFVQRSAPEHAELSAGWSFDVRAWFRKRRATASRQNAHLDQGPWTLSGWLCDFDPTEEGMGDDRSWWWWDAGSDEPGTGWVEVATTGWPFGSGSLFWLIEASGGRYLEYGA